MVFIIENEIKCIQVTKHITNSFSPGKEYDPGSLGLSLFPVVISTFFCQTLLESKQINLNTSNKSTYNVKTSLSLRYLRVYCYHENKIHSVITFTMENNNR